MSSKAENKKSTFPYLDSQHMSHLTLTVKLLNPNKKLGRPGDIIELLEVDISRARH